MGRGDSRAGDRRRFGFARRRGRCVGRARGRCRWWPFTAAPRSALICSQALITRAQISAGKVPPITGPPL